MTKLVADDGRTHIESLLMRESLQKPQRCSPQTESEREPQDLPRCPRWSRSAVRASCDRGKRRDPCRWSTSSPMVKRPPQDLDRRRWRNSRASHDVDRASISGCQPAASRSWSAAMEGAQRDPPQRVGSRPQWIDADAARSLLGSGRCTSMPASPPIAIRRLPPFHFWEPPPMGRERYRCTAPIFGLFQLAEVLGMKAVDLRQGTRTASTIADPQAAPRRKADPEAHASEELIGRMPKEKHPRRGSSIGSWHEGEEPPAGS